MKFMWPIIARMDYKTDIHKVGIFIPRPLRRKKNSFIKKGQTFKNKSVLRFWRTKTA